MIIDKYLAVCLVPQLASLRLTKRQIKLVCQDVSSCLGSILHRWNDVPFRKTVLLAGREESEFYVPSSADEDARALVVVGIRNTLVEDLASDWPYARGSPRRRQLIMAIMLLRCL